MNEVGTGALKRDAVSVASPVGDIFSLYTNVMSFSSAFHIRDELNKTVLLLFLCGAQPRNNLCEYTQYKLS